MPRWFAALALALFGLVIAGIWVFRSSPHELVGIGMGLLVLLVFLLSEYSGHGDRLARCIERGWVIFRLGICLLAAAIVGFTCLFALIKLPGSMQNFVFETILFCAFCGLLHLGVNGVRKP